MDYLDPEAGATVERIDTEQGRVDALANETWGGEKLIEWEQPMWK